MKRRKSKGSSLLTVVVIFAVLATMGAAMLTLTGTDYNLRIKESKRVQNLYSSDSGLDIIFAGAKLVINDAIENGNNAASSSMNNLLSQSRNTQNIDQANLKAQLNTTFQSTYKTYIQNNLLSNIQNYFAHYVNNHNQSVDLNTINGVNISASYISGYDSYNSSNEIRINVTSTFASSSGDNKRKVSAILSVDIPQYSTPYSFTSETLKSKSSHLFDYGMAIDGNMHIKSNFSVSNGPTYVKGVVQGGNTNSDIVFDKYRYGVEINGSSNTVNFQELLTPSNLSIKGDHTQVSINNNVYAKNVYVGKIDATDVAANCNLTVGNSVYTNNDLALNATASNITLGNYYGINEIDYDPLNIIDTTLPANQEASDSSSIIVNSDDIGNGSSITINHDAYILGVAYIKNTDPSNVNKPYRTGESVAIKGNYYGYGNIDEQHKNNLTTAQQNDPNHLLSALHDLFDGLLPVSRFNYTQNNVVHNESLTSFDKSKYISLYDSAHVSDNNLKKSGVSLASQGGTIITNGSYINSSNKINEYSYSLDTQQQQSINDKRQDYQHNALQMSISPYSDITDNEIASNTIKKVVMNIVDPSQTAMVNLNNLSNTNTVVNNGDNTKDIKVFNRDSSKNVVIIGSSAGNVSTNTNDIVIDISDVNSAKGMIITTGDIEVYGNINYSGIILAGGNFDDMDTNTKNFSADKTYVEKTIAISHNNYINNPTVNTVDYESFFNNINSMADNTVENATSLATNNLNAYHVDGEVVKYIQWKLLQ